MIKAITIAALLSAGAISDPAEFRTLCDFDTLARAWMAEHGPTPEVAYTSVRPHSRSGCLAVRVRRDGGRLRATWGCDVLDVSLSPDTRFRFAARSDPPVKTEPGQPHGGLVLVESGGGENGGDSHWMLDIPGTAWASSKWSEFVTAPVREARNPEWALDANGRIDYARIHRILFIVQRDDPSGAAAEFTIYLDDLSASSWTAREPVIRPAENHSVPAHVRPVQRGFVGRERDAGQRVVFSDLTGWRVVHYGGSEASFVRSEEEPLFGEPVGKLTYRSAGGPGYVRLEPPEPIALEEFNAALFWVFGNNWHWQPDPTTPPVLLSLEIVDAADETHVVQLDQVVWKFWSMMHKVVRADIRADERHTSYGGDANGRLDFPARLTAIEVRGGANTEPRSIYLDSVIFRVERPNLPEFRAKLDDLPCPTTPDTILPSLESPARNWVERDGDTYHFCVSDGGGEMEYIYQPVTGTLSDVRVRIGGREFRPCDGAGPQRDDRTPKVGLRGAWLGPGGVLRTEWVGEDGLDYSLELRIKGRSLICDWKSMGTSITGFTIGRATGLADCKLFNVPYLTMGWGTHPAVLWDDGVYCFALLDWHNTNASQFYGRTDLISGSEAAYNGGSRYLSMTDGGRNPLKERLFITVSPRFEEVLPNIPNPPSPLSEITGKHLYCHMGGIELDRYQRYLEIWRLYKEYGIDHVRVSHHEDAWTDADTSCQGPQEFTMTLEAAPEIGDEQLIDYCRAVRELGWLVGLYANYTDYSMLGKSWDERNVTKLPNGEWKRSWPPTFSLKPLKAVEMQAWYAPRIAEKFGTNTVYSDVHTAVTPWENVDYEAGTPGAGMLITQFRSYGALLLNEREAYGGPVFSEGTHHWFYAGLLDGNYAQMGLPQPEKQPLLLDFDLRKIHPLEADVAMGPWPAWGENYYHLAATQIAYGHIGYLHAGDIATAARTYYLMQQIQSRYTQAPVDVILYRAADGRMLDVSAALPIAANAENQVYVRYKNGLQIYANCSGSKRWGVTVGDREFTLPPYGWVAWSDDFLEYSAEFDGRRVDFVDSPTYVYGDSGGSEFDFGAVRANGSFVLRRDDPRGLKLIPIACAGRVLVRNVSGDRVLACAGAGAAIGEAVFERVADGMLISLEPDARCYIILPSGPS